MNKKIVFILPLLLPAVFLSAFAETIVLKSGKTIEGKILEKTDKAIRMDISGIPITYYFEDIETIDGQMPIVPIEKIIKPVEKDIRRKQEETIPSESNTAIIPKKAQPINIKVDPEVGKVADIYCAIFQARNESGLGKPVDVLQPRAITMDDASSKGQQFQQAFVAKMMPLMKKYGWDSGKLGEENTKADELMKGKSFREKVSDVLRKRDGCFAEYLD